MRFAQATRTYLGRNKRTYSDLFCWGRNSYWKNTPPPSRYQRQFAQKNRRFASGFSIIKLPFGRVWRLEVGRSIFLILSFNFTDTGRTGTSRTRRYALRKEVGRSRLMARKHLWSYSSLVYSGNGLMPPVAFGRWSLVSRWVSFVCWWISLRRWIQTFSSPKDHSNPDNRGILTLAFRKCVEHEARKLSGARVGRGLQFRMSLRGPPEIHPVTCHASQSVQHLTQTALDVAAHRGRGCFGLAAG